jgi:tungstate transport system substrate-binding protein
MLRERLVSIAVRSVATYLLVAAAVVASQAAGNTVRMATTTSTDNSGLLRELLPALEKQTGIGVHVIAVGTGNALKLGQNGDVDVVFVHARKAEDEFVAKGYGVNRRDVMYNDFIVVGPKKDPAGIGGSASAAKALAAIAKAQTPFVSRGDQSGTHKKELALWEAAKVKPSGAWYVQAGQGMGAVLTMANEKQAYTLTDRGTLIAFEEKISLVVLCEEDTLLYNPYGIIAVNPKKHPDVKYDDTMRLIEWLTSPKGQSLIAGFRLNGKQLFYPNAEAVAKK